jgi:hypothetical protein
MLTVHVKTLDDKTYELYADRSDTILSLKIKINELGGPEFDKQTIIYRGTKLEDHQYLEVLGLPDSCHDPVYMHLVTYKEAIVTVQIKKDNEIVFQIKWDYKTEDKAILHLKRDVSLALKLPPVSIRKMELFREDGTKLENSQSMKELIKKEQCESFVFTVTL